MELTKEYFEQHLDRRLKLSESRILERIDKAQEELAQMVSDGFDDVQVRLDFREQVKAFEQKFQKLEEALHIKL